MFSARLVLVTLFGPGLLVGTSFLVDRCDRHGGLPPVATREGGPHAWLLSLPRPAPAWPDQPRVQPDRAAPLAAHGSLLLIGCSQSDSLLAVEAATGVERWRFETEGPIRFAPAVWQGRVYLASDDGYLYCLVASTGELSWKHRGGPSGQKLLGNGRLISAWPARGAPVVVRESATPEMPHRATVYYAAGIWPFMGVFLHALDAEDGSLVWTNDGDGSLFIKQPHQTDAFAGVAPQGRLVAEGDRLLVPGGRSVPACYDRHTGRLLHYQLANNSRLGGGWEVQAAGEVFLNGGSAFDIQTGDHLLELEGPGALTRDRLFTCSGSVCREYDLRAAGPARQLFPSLRKGRLSQASWRPHKAAEASIPPAEVLHLAGRRLYGAGRGRVFALDLPLSPGRRSPSWQAPLRGRPAHLLAHAGRLFVSTEEGEIHSFVPDRPGAMRPPVRLLPDTPPSPTAEDAAQADRILELAGPRQGYALVLGAPDPGVLIDVVRRSSLRLIVLEPDLDRVRQGRAVARRARIPGARLSYLHGSLASCELPPYLAELVLCADPVRVGFRADAAQVGWLFRSLRPHGGLAWLNLPPGSARRLGDELAGGDILPQARITEASAGVLLLREGPLPGAGSWTHQHADAANTRTSRDQIVKAPLGLLWFGGSSHEGILPRHGHGPQPQVLDGRLIVEGPDLLRALDIYTGRILWEAPLPGVGKVYDNTAHQPGANGTGSNYVTTADGIYVAYGRGCLRLDPATGRVQSRFRLPTLPGEEEAPTWSYINVLDRYLVGGANREEDLPRGRTVFAASSDHLTVLDRASGKVLWGTRSRNGGFRHNAICMGGDYLFAIDRPPSRYAAWPKRGSKGSAGAAEVVAFDLRTGAERWRQTRDVFGTWLSYSREHDVLVEAGHVGRDTLPDEPRGMRAYRASTGEVLWHSSRYTGPAMIHGSRILQGNGACELLTGKPILRPDPLTGELTEWTWTRTYGCNTPAASEHLLTFRSGAAGYYDLCGEGGTGNFGGFRSGCTNNLIVAGGVLTAPDYTRTCTCSYQNQTSLALVPMPSAEMWTFQGGSREVGGVIRRLGLLLGAPGNRRAADGTLWLAWPAPALPGPRLDVEIDPEEPSWFRRHTSRIAGGEEVWRGSAGARGLRSLTLKLAPGEDGEDPTPARPYRVRLVFVEPDDILPGERVFDVHVQGKLVLKGVDVVREADGPYRMLVRDLGIIDLAGELRIDLVPAPSSKAAPVLSGAELQAEGW